MITERHVELAAKLYDARRAVRNLFGERYAGVIAPWRQVVRGVAARLGCAAIEVPLRIEPKPDGEAMVMLLAAVVEECEGPRGERLHDR